MQALTDWYMAEKAAIEADNPMNGAKFMLGGGIIYGGLFLGVFHNYCLASILAPKNRAALAKRGTTIAFYTDEATKVALELTMTRAKAEGINAIVRVVPDAVMQSDRRWERIAAAQALQVMMVALNGGAFHVMMPDQVYNDTFFPNLFRLAQTHKNIIHNGLNAQSSCADELQRYRQTDGSLAIPAKDLNSIAWRYLHSRMHVMAERDLSAERLVNGHYQMWRARDRVLMFGPHNSLSYLSNEACKKHRKDTSTETEAPTGTMDVWVQRLVDTNFFVPEIDDDVSVIGFEVHPHDSTPRQPDCTLQEYCAWSWAQIRMEDRYLVYYSEPTANLPLFVDESAPPFEAVMAMQQRIVEMMKEHKV